MADLNPNLLCAGCGLSKASKECSICGPLCDVCAEKVHQVLKTHKLVPLGSSFGRCEIHNEIKKYYCGDCVKLVCHDCGLDAKCCKFHKVSQVSEVAKQKISAVADLVRHVEAQQPSFNKILDYLEHNRLPNLQKEFELAEKEATQILHQELELRQKYTEELLNDPNSCFKRYEEKAHAVWSLKFKVDKLIKEANKLLESDLEAESSQIGTLRIYDELRKALEALCEKSLIEMEKTIKAPKVVFDFSELRKSFMHLPVSFASVPFLTESNDPPKTEAPEISMPLILKPLAASKEVTVSKMPRNDSSGKPSKVVSILAGCGMPGMHDGRVFEATFNSPHALAIDSVGDIFVADSKNHVIRKISISDGSYRVKIYAGSTQGAQVGSRLQAQFNSPIGLAIDSKDNLYVADYYNHRVCKVIKSTDEVVVLAGDGIAGNGVGRGIGIRFNCPVGLALDSKENLYVSDHNNHCIKSMNHRDGSIEIYAGACVPGFEDGEAKRAMFRYPCGIAFDKHDNLYVADFLNRRIRMVNTHGIVSTIAGCGANDDEDGLALEASFKGPSGLCVDHKGDIIVADCNSQTLRRIYSEYGSVFVVTLGSEEQSDDVETFNKPYSVISGRKDVLYVADYGSNMIKTIS